MPDPYLNIEIRIQKSTTCNQIEYVLASRFHTLCHWTGQDVLISDLDTTALDVTRCSVLSAALQMNSIPIPMCYEKFISPTLRSHSDTQLNPRTGIIMPALMTRICTLGYLTSEGEL